MYDCFVCVYVSAPYVYLVPAEVKRQHQSLMNSSHKCIKAAMWMLRPEDKSSVRVVSPFSPVSHWSSPLYLAILNLLIKGI